MGIRFILEGGALLGAVRDGDFIPWDDDVDVACRTEELYPKASELALRLEASGFERVEVNRHWRDFKVRARRGCITYEVLGWHLRGRMRCRRCYQMPADFLERTEEIVLRGTRYPCPSPPERYLCWFYGDWRIPRRKGPFFTQRCRDWRNAWARRLRKLIGLAAR